jgi:hypothetical protein
MKSRVKHIILLLALLGPLFASATIIRVNPNGAALAPFTDLQLAHDAANAGDTIFAEGNENLVLLAVVSPYSAVITKQLVIIGPGYYLNQNNPDIELDQAAICSSIVVASGGQGTILTGLTIESLTIQTDFVEVRGNQISHASCVDNNNLEISDNFMQGVTPFVPVLNMDGVNVSNIHNNIILHDSGFTSGQFAIQEIGSFGNIINHNVIGNANSIFDNSQVINNIFVAHTIDALQGATFDNNIFPVGYLEVAPFDPFGSPNDDTPVLGNPSNLFEVDMFTVFVGTASPSLDGQYQLIPGTVAEGFGNDGDNAGPYTLIDPYIPSGAQSIPIVTSLDVNPSDNQLSLLPVTFTALAVDPLAVINQAEFFVNADPGFGDATSIVITPGNEVIGFFGVDTQGLPAGTHILGLRVRDDQGQWSQDAFTTFIVQDPPPIPSLGSMLYAVSAADVIDFDVFTEVPSSFGGNIEEFIEFIDLSAYPPGMANLSFRMVDSNGAPSTTYTAPILIIEDQLPDPDLAYLEYYFDDDPGYQNAFIIEIDAGVQLFDDVVQQDLTGLPLGPQTIWIRLRDTEGGFSVTQQRDIVVVSDVFEVADLNDDCVIDVLDLLILLAYYGCNDPDMLGICEADFNMDYVVDALDLLQFLSVFGTTCTP